MFTSTAIGVYASGRSVFIAEVVNQFGRNKITKSAEETIPGAIAGGEDVALAQAMKKAFTKAAIQRRPVTLSVPENESMVRYFEMPLLPKKEWKTSVRFEAQKYVPFDLRELATDYKISIDKRNSKMRIMFFAMRKEVLESRLEAIRGAGFNVRSVEPSSVSMMRCFYPDKPRNDVPVQAYVDPKNDGTVNIVIGKPNLMLMARHCVVTRFSETQEKTRPIPEAILPDLQLSFNYFYKNFKDQKVISIVVAGEEGGPDAATWTKLAKSEFEILGNVKNPILKYGISGDYHPEVATAAGAAISGFSSNVNWKINLVEPAERKKKAAVSGLSSVSTFDKETVQKYVLTEAAVFIVLFGILQFATQSHLSSKQKAINAIQRGYSDQMAAFAALPVPELEMKRNELQKKKTYLDDLIKNRIYCTTKLTEVAKLVPRSVQLERLVYSDMDNKEQPNVLFVELQGSVLGRGEQGFLEVDKFLNSMSQDADFMKGLEALRVASIKKTTEGPAAGTDFEIEGASPARPRAY